MKNSNKRIEKMEPRVPRHNTEGVYHWDDLVCDKLNEIIDKVNSLEDGFEFNFEQLSTVSRTLAEAGERNTKLIGSIRDRCFKRQDKLESQPEEPKKECEHDYSNALLSNPPQYQCSKCGKIIKRFYTSEGDAVGEVEKKCEHEWRIHKYAPFRTCDLCSKFEDLLKENHEPKKD